MKEMWHLAKNDPIAYYKKYGCLFLSMIVLGLLLLMFAACPLIFVLR